MQVGGCNRISLPARCIPQMAKLWIANCWDNFGVCTVRISSKATWLNSTIFKYYSICVQFKNGTLDCLDPPMFCMQILNWRRGNTFDQLRVRRIDLPISPNKSRPTPCEFYKSGLMLCINRALRVFAESRFMVINCPGEIWLQYTTRIWIPCPSVSDLNLCFCLEFCTPFIVRFEY